MPEGHAIAAFTQTGAMAVPASQNPMESGAAGEFVGLDQVDERAPVNVNSARQTPIAQCWCHAARQKSTAYPKGPWFGGRFDKPECGREQPVMVIAGSDGLSAKEDIRRMSTERPLKAHAQTSPYQNCLVSAFNLCEVCSRSKTVYGA
jgi:hypothetical protein